MSLKKRWQSRSGKFYTFGLTAFGGLACSLEVMGSLPGVHGAMCPVACDDEAVDGLKCGQEVVGGLRCSHEMVDNPACAQSASEFS